MCNLVTPFLQEADGNGFRFDCSFKRFMLLVPWSVKRINHWFQKFLGHTTSGIEQNSDSVSLSTGVSRSQGAVACGDLSSTVSRGLGGVTVSGGALCSSSGVGACSTARSVRFA